MAGKTKLFYIGTRYNPQLSKPYYRAYGQLTIKESKAKEDCVYGSMYLTGYTKEEYLAKLESLKAEGYNVYSN